MNPSFRLRLEEIRRGKWVIVAATVITMLSTALPSVLADPTYLAKSALVVSSPDRATDQDALLAVGYATLFNDPANNVRLRAMKNLPDDIVFEARTAAASPIVTVEAIAADPKLAQDAAEAMAVALRDDINAVRKKENERLIADLTRQLNELFALPGADGAPNLGIGPLQERIGDIRSDSTSQLRDLQLRAGVIRQAPDVVLNVALGAVGGLLLGVLMVLLYCRVLGRPTATELQQRTGVRALVEVPSGGDPDGDSLRAERLRTLANIIRLGGQNRAQVVALTDVAGAGRATELAGAMANLSAQQGYRTVLVHANEATRLAGQAGFTDALADRRTVRSLLVDGAAETLRIMPSGSEITDRYATVTRERVAAVLDELRSDADAVFVAAPAIDESSETQVVCAAADATILVVSGQYSRSRDVSAAAETLAQSHVTLLGAVVVDGEVAGRPVAVPAGAPRT